MTSRAKQVIFSQLSIDNIELLPNSLLIELEIEDKTKKDSDLIMDVDSFVIDSEISKLGLDEDFKDNFTSLQKIKNMRKYKGRIVKMTDDYKSISKHKVDDIVYFKEGSGVDFFLSDKGYTLLSGQEGIRECPILAKEEL